MSESVEKPTPLERIPSGIVGLDVILGGGFLRGGTYIVMGTPGAGKTILGNQICFHHVTQGGRAVYVTLLSESHGRMLTHLQTMKFFDPAPIAAALTYVSGYRILEEHGLSGLLELLRKSIREHRATLLVLDGLVSAEEFAPSELLFKKFIHELNTTLGLIGCTTFLLTNGTTRVNCPEHTMVDGLVELSDTQLTQRSIREITVRKFRGSDHLRGKHIFDISSDGITVYPRTEMLLGKRPHTPGPEWTMLDSGIPALDKLLGGGFPSGSTTMLLGPSGSGKTTLGLNFLAAGAKKGEMGLHFGFFESPERLAARGDGLGLAISNHVESGVLEIAWQPTVELLADALAERLLKLVRVRGARRLFIDGLVGFSTSIGHQERLSRFLSALWNELRYMNVTTLFTQETKVLFGPGIEVPIEGLSALCENIVFVRQVEYRSDLKRVISVLKARENEHCAAIHTFEITRQGVVLEGRLQDDAEAIVTGVVRTSVKGVKRRKRKADEKKGSRDNPGRTSDERKRKASKEGGKRARRGG